jgi:hypothetical protein
MKKYYQSKLNTRGRYIGTDHAYGNDRPKQVNYNCRNQKSNIESTTPIPSHSYVFESGKMLLPNVTSDAIMSLEKRYKIPKASGKLRCTPQTP